LKTIKMKSFSILAALAVVGTTFAAPTPDIDSVDEGMVFGRGISNNGPITVRDEEAVDGSVVDEIVDEAVDTIGAVLDLATSADEPTEGGDFGATPIDNGAQAQGNLPGLDGVQSRNARWIMEEVKKTGTGWQGCMAAITTAITEVRRRALIRGNQALTLPHSRACASWPTMPCPRRSSTHATASALTTTASASTSSALSGTRTLPATCAPTAAPASSSTA